jgi:hypothetical protein
MPQRLDVDVPEQQRLHGGCHIAMVDARDDHHERIHWHDSQRAVPEERDGRGALMAHEWQIEQESAQHEEQRDAGVPGDDECAQQVGLQRMGCRELHVRVKQDDQQDGDAPQRFALHQMISVRPQGPGADASAIAEQRAECSGKCLWKNGYP